MDVIPATRRPNLFRTIPQNIDSKTVNTSVNSFTKSPLNSNLTAHDVLIQAQNRETALELLTSYNTLYDVEDIQSECDDIDYFKDWLNDTNEEEYEMYFGNTTRKFALTFSR